MTNKLIMIRYRQIFSPVTLWNINTRTHSFNLVLIKTTWNISRCTNTFLEKTDSFVYCWLSNVLWIWIWSYTRLRSDLCLCLLFLIFLTGLWVFGPVHPDCAVGPLPTLPGHVLHCPLSGSQCGGKLLPGRRPPLPNPLPAACQALLTDSPARCLCEYPWICLTTGATISSIGAIIHYVVTALQPSVYNGLSC